MSPDRLDISRFGTRVLRTPYRPFMTLSASTRVALVVGALSALSVLASCSAAEPDSADSAASFTAVEQMSVAFDGMPDEATIQSALDRAFAATDLEATEDNYSRAGSVLVTFRKEYGITEMDILDCIPSRQRDPRITEHTFSNVAAVCVTDLATGN